MTAFLLAGANHDSGLCQHRVQLRRVYVLPNNTAEMVIREAPSDAQRLLATALPQRIADVRARPDDPSLDAFRFPEGINVECTGSGTLPINTVRSQALSTNGSSED